MIELIPAFLVCLYFIPFMVAAGREHDSTVVILLANLFLGWTVIGWFAVFFFALLSPAGGAGQPVARSYRAGDLGLPEARRVKDEAKIAALPPR